MRKIFDKERFKYLREQKNLYLKKLTLEKAKKMMNSLLIESFYKELKNNMIDDHPLSLKKSVESVFKKGLQKNNKLLKRK